MQQQATTTGRAWALWRAMQQYITLHVFFFLSIYCGIMHYNGAHAGPDLVDCQGGGCSRLLLHAASLFNLS